MSSVLAFLPWILIIDTFLSFLYSLLEKVIQSEKNGLETFLWISFFSFNSSFSCFHINSSWFHTISLYRLSCSRQGMHLKINLAVVINWNIILCGISPFFFLFFSFFHSRVIFSYHRLKKMWKLLLFSSLSSLFLLHVIFRPAWRSMKC